MMNEFQIKVEMSMCCMFPIPVVIDQHRFNDLILLQKPVVEKLSTTIGELENSGLLCQWAQRH